MRIIGITGGIGSGKTTASEYLKSRGFHVIDADRIGHEIMQPGMPILIELAMVFGGDILDDNGVLNRKKLAEAAFDDPQNKKMLDSITHKEIFEEIRRRMDILSDQGVKIVFLDAALLFETGLENTCEQTWLIDAEDKIRIKRAMDRDGSTRDQVLARLKNQMSSEEKRKRASHIIDNSGDLEQLYKQLDVLISGLEKL